MLENIINWINELRSIDINIEELRFYIGFLLLFGVFKKRDVEICKIWSANSLDFLPQAQAAMSRNRFSEITKKFDIL